MLTWNILSLQNRNSPLIEQIIYFHDHIIFILIIITLLVRYIIITLFFNNLNNKFLLERQNLEIIWTLLPMLILIFIALPSLKLLYTTDEINNPLLTIKTLGHQWYWSYEYSDFNNIEFDSYLLNWENKFNFRLLDVDNRIILPYKSQIRILISSTDVIHAWTIPSLIIKIDALPGRINQIAFSIYKTGIFFGQCSEICGTNHRFMPICLERVSPTTFLKWIKNFNYIRLLKVSNGLLSQLIVIYVYF